MKFPLLQISFEFVNHVDAKKHLFMNKVSVWAVEEGGHCLLCCSSDGQYGGRFLLEHTSGVERWSEVETYADSPKQPHNLLLFISSLRSGVKLTL